MIFSKRKIILILGDLAICYVSLWVAISVRELSVVEGQIFLKFAVTFSTVFFVWMLTLYTLGLYEILALPIYFLVSIGMTHLITKSPHTAGGAALSRSKQKIFC